MHINLHIALFKRQIAVTEVAHPASNDLFNTTQIVPRLHDVDLANVFEIQALGPRPGNENHLDAVAVAVGGVVQLRQFFAVVRGKILVAGDHCVAQRRACCALGRRLHKHGLGPTADTGRTDKPRLLQGQRHRHHASVNKLGINHHDADGPPNTVQDGGDFMAKGPQAFQFKKPLLVAMIRKLLILGHVHHEVQSLFPYQGVGGPTLGSLEHDIEGLYRNPQLLVTHVVQVFQDGAQGLARHLRLRLWPIGILSIHGSRRRIHLRLCLRVC